MRAIDIEIWTRRIVEQVMHGKTVEDSRVELKRDWPGDANKAARRIGALCNVNVGETVLWLIGADEERGAVGAAPQELANWWPQVVAEFDGEIPPMRDVIVDVGEASVVALALDAGRAPFVVRNQAYGKPNGGPVSLEVPWREGTMVRSARRTDLLRMLIPTEPLPGIEIIEHNGWIERRFADSKGSMAFTVTCYAVVPMGASLVVPNHQAKAAAVIYGLNEELDLEVQFLAQRHPPSSFPGQRGSDTRVHTVVQGAVSNLMIRGRVRG